MAVRVLTRNIHSYQKSLKLWWNYSCAMMVKINAKEKWGSKLNRCICSRTYQMCIGYLPGGEEQNIFVHGARWVFRKHTLTDSAFVMISKLQRCVGLLWSILGNMCWGINSRNVDLEITRGLTCWGAEAFPCQIQANRHEWLDDFQGHLFQNHVNTAHWRPFSCFTVPPYYLSGVREGGRELSKRKEKKEKQWVNMNWHDG